MARSAKHLLVMGLLLLVAAMRVPVLHAQEAPPSRAPDVSKPSGSGDVAGLVEVGDGRRLWLECRGTGVNRWTKVRPRSMARRVPFGIGTPSDPRDDSIRRRGGR
jgi:hypothetical protein